MFEQLLMQVTDIQVVTDLIQNLGILIGTIGGILTPVLLWVKKRVSEANKEAHQAIDLGIQVGQLGTAFAQKTAELKEDIRITAEVLNELSPEQFKEVLKRNRTNLEKINKEVVVAYEQLKRLESRLPEEAKANNIKDLPR